MSRTGRLAVRLTPRGGHDAIEGWIKDADGRDVLRVRVAAAAVEGAANAALVALIAKTLKVPRRAVRLVAGEHARLKLLEIDGLDAEALATAFGRPS